MKSKQKNEKKTHRSMNAFFIVFLVIVACYVASLFISPGAFERQVVNGRTIVVPNSYHAIPKKFMGPQAIFQAIPYGLESSASMVFLVVIVAGCIEIYKRTGALDKGVARIVAKSNTVGSNTILIGIMIAFALMGGFLGWNEQIVPFIPIVISMCLALGYDVLTGLACSAMVDMLSFSISPTSVYTVGISDEIAQLPMFSGMGFRLIILLIFDIIIFTYVLHYAKKVKEDPSKSLVADLDDSSFRIDYTEATKERMTINQSVSLVLFVITFIIAIYGVAKLKWSMNDLSAAFVFAGIMAGIICRLNPDEIINGFIEGAKGGFAPAMVIGLARGIQWILQQGGIIDPIINAISKPLMQLPGWATAIGVLFVISLFNGLITSGSAKAMALMPILIPLADLIGMTRQTMILAFQFGDGLTNSVWFTSGTLLIFLTIGKVPLKRWYKFIWPLIIMLFIVAIISLIVATNVGYGPF
jgi:uncharacterized ion transporter superfamily protein YfcC